MQRSIVHQQMTGQALQKTCLKASAVDSSVLSVYITGSYFGQQVAGVFLQRGQFKTGQNCSVPKCPSYSINLHYFDSYGSDQQACAVFIKRKMSKKFVDYSLTK
ncbi:hypothetical protein T10_12445 [Trichinella papuae]|uniref:Uncharacterized protein n=1 Tax=Trichinella papuae TaxID=268474 RepID=A0A0V1N9R0_9BILA|nr:hypothetical protein T10_12445 [Trichinella papuae]